ncbi:uncharacterized peptidase y4nA [Arthrobacter sp. Hiyo4]|nr:uncharacterized peptidase y4nA [Arthrobacter sp. Hiyo4]
MTTTAADQAPGSSPAPEPTDENVWLEEIYGEAPLAWVREQNARTEDLLEDADYAGLEGSILEVLDSTDRIAMVGKRGEWYYNFWKDQANPKGLWRRTTWESYLTDSPDWDVLLDVDALAAAEGEEWVFHGATFLRPAAGDPYRLALLALSPDGGDANRYREFDVGARTFVDPASGVLTCRRRRGTFRGWTRTRCWSPPRQGPAADRILVCPDGRHPAARRGPLRGCPAF